MRILTIILALSFSASSYAGCHTGKLARDTVRAIALVSDMSMITDIVGGCPSVCNIWANYRNHGYSDYYTVQIDENSCRVTELKLIEAHQPVKDAG